MAVVAFDTLKLADRLQAGGFSAEQARTAAGAFADALSGSDLATKADLMEVRAEFKADFASVKSDIARSKSEMEAKLSETKSDLLKWVFGALAAQTAFLSLIKFFGH